MISALVSSQARHRLSAAARQATRNLAKRQLTWLRGDPAIAWVSSLAERDLVPIYDAMSSAAEKIGAKPLC